MFLENLLELLFNCSAAYYSICHFHYAANQYYDNIHVWVRSFQGLSSEETSLEIKWQITLLKPTYNSSIINLVLNVWLSGLQTYTCLENYLGKKMMMMSCEGSELMMIRREFCGFRSQFRRENSSFYFTQLRLVVSPLKSPSIHENLGLFIERTIRWLQLFNGTPNLDFKLSIPQPNSFPLPTINHSH